MNRTFGPLMYRLFGRIEGKPLKPRWPELRKIDTNPDRPPIWPVLAVDDDRLELHDNYHTFRNFWLLPFTVAWLALSAHFILERVDWVQRAQVKQIADMEMLIEKHGEQYIENLIDEPGYIGFELIYPDRELTWKEYHYDLYFGRPGDYHWLGADILVVVMFFLPAIGLTIWLIRWRRPAPVVFDRRRQAVYSWYDGTLYARRWEDLTVLDNRRGVSFVLPAEGAVDSYDWRRFNVQPTSMPGAEAPETNAYLLAVVVRFMEEGIAAIAPEPMRKRNTFALRHHKRPEPFEDRLTAQLEANDDRPG